MKKSINNSWQLYISKLVSEKDLIAFLSKELDLPVESLNYPDPLAKIFVMIATYEAGFLMGVNISWNQKLKIKKTEIELGKNTAEHFNVQVVIDSIIDPSDPHRWTLIEPDKKMYDIRDDSSQTSDQYLSFDMDTKEEISH